MLRGRVRPRVHAGALSAHAVPAISCASCALRPSAWALEPRRLRSQPPGD